MSMFSSSTIHHLRIDASIDLHPLYNPPTLDPHLIHYFDYFFSFFAEQKKLIIIELFGTICIFYSISCLLTIFPLFYDLSFFVPLSVQKNYLSQHATHTQQPPTHPLIPPAHACALSRFFPLIPSIHPPTAIVAVDDDGRKTTHTIQTPQKKTQHKASLLCIFGLALDQPSEPEEPLVCW